MNKGVENFFGWVYISANEIKFIKKEISFMRLSNIKKVVVSVGLALGLVSGSMVAFGAPSKVITPGQSTVVTAPRGVNAQVIEDGNTRIVIVGEGQRVPSQIVTPGAATNTQIRRATFSNATVSNATISNATRSNASSSSSSSSRGRSSGSSYGGGSARPVSTNNTNTTNNVGPNGNSYNSNTANVNTNTKNVGPAGANNNGATKGDVTAAKRGRLNVPKTADASAMGLYAALLGLSAVGGALVVATKKKEN